MTSRDEVAELASQVVARLLPGLLVRTQESRFWSTTPDEEVLQGIVVSAGIDVSVGRRSQSVDVKTTYNVDALRRPEGADDSAGDLPAEAWRSSVVLHGQWHIEEPQTLSDDAVRAFAVKVGVMTLHPYARAHIQTAVVAAGWPTYTLDVLTHQDDLFVSEDDPESVDLNLVTLD